MYTCLEVINHVREMAGLSLVATPVAAPVASPVATEEWYKDKCMNWNGTTIGTPSLLMTEVIAEQLLNAPLNGIFPGSIPQITRASSYASGHNGITAAPQKKPDEERYAIALYNQNHGCLGPLGQIFDYQVPLKNQRSDRAGKIDLVSYNVQTKTVYLIELKIKASSETLLRCVTEIETYYHQLDHAKFLQDHQLCGNEIKKAVLIFEDSRQHESLTPASAMPNWRALCTTYGIQVFTIGNASNPPVSLDVTDDPTWAALGYRPILTPAGSQIRVQQVFP